MLLRGDRLAAAASWWQHRMEVTEMFDLLLILGVLLGLPALSQAARLIIGLFFRLLAVSFVMAMALIVLLIVATHGRLI